MREYILCLLAAAAVTYLTMPLARRLAIAGGFIAPVRDRDVHATPTPRLGGLAMLAGLLAGLLLASKLPMMGAVFEGGSTPLALLSGVAVIVALVGILLTLVGALAILKQLDRAWVLVRRAAGYDQREGVVGRVFAYTAFVGVSIFGLWLVFGGGLAQMGEGGTPTPP